MSARRAPLALLAETGRAWWRGQSLRLGAALAYYTVFSLAPLLIVAIGVAGLLFDREAARAHLLEQLRGLVGPEGAAAIGALVESAARREDASVLATAIAAGTMLLGASGAFAQLQAALDEIWGAEGRPQPGGVRGALRRRLLSLGMVLAIGFLLLVSLLLATGIAALDELVRPAWRDWQALLALLNGATSLALATLLFAAIFKVLPDRDVAWRDVAVGAFATALLFEVGKWAIGVYLGNAAVGSMYGAFGSLVVLMVWVYYSSQIVFLGAQFTRIWSHPSSRRSRSRVGGP